MPATKTPAARAAKTDLAKLSEPALRRVAAGLGLTVEKTAKRGKIEAAVRTIADADEAWAKVADLAKEPAKAPRAKAAAAPAPAPAKPAAKGGKAALNPKRATKEETRANVAKTRRVAEEAAAKVSGRAAPAKGKAPAAPAKPVAKGGKAPAAPARGPGGRKASMEGFLIRITDTGKNARRGETRRTENFRAIRDGMKYEDYIAKTRANGGKADLDTMHRLNHVRFEKPAAKGGKAAK